VERRAEALTLVDCRQLEGAGDFYEPVRIFRGPQVFDRDFFPLYRRFLCACCRALDPLLTEESRRALDVIEAFAYGRASFSEFVAARDAAKVAARRVAKREGCRSRRHAASEAVRDAARNEGFEALMLGCRAARRAGLTIRQLAGFFERVAGEWAAEEA
jgi:hypothetical protein